MADTVSGFLLCAAAVFVPWAFGTTEPWSIAVMNTAGLILGGLLAWKWLARWRTGFEPARWDAPGTGRRRLIRGLAGLTFLLLAWCLIAAWNARSDFFYRQHAFLARPYRHWLPASFDSYASWQSFWMYLGLAGYFWALRDWLLGKTAAERRADRETAPETGNTSCEPACPGALPRRLELFLWVLCLNGALLATECILQRLSGTHQLLGILPPGINRDREDQFGPWAYRSNAAQYFNLLWPVTLGLWWSLRDAARQTRRATARVGGGRHLMLLPCVALLIAAPLVSLSRGGTLIALAQIAACAALIFLALRRTRWWLQAGLAVLFLASIGLAWNLAGERALARFQAIGSDDLGGRSAIYTNATAMAADYPLFGTGPGTFPWVYHLYRATPAQKWEGYAHNDWLETRITFGGAGFALVLAALVIVAVLPLAPGRIPVPGTTLALVGLALVGCLVHARFDFPMQIYSTLSLVLTLCCVMTIIGHRR